MTEGGGRERMGTSGRGDPVCRGAPSSEPQSDRARTGQEDWDSSRRPLQMVHGSASPLWVP